MFGQDQQKVQNNSYDELLRFKINIHKFHQIIALQSNTVMIVHHNYEYIVIRLNTARCQIVSKGKFDGLCQNIQKFGSNSVIYVLGKIVQIYDWVLKECVCSFGASSNVSSIYYKITSYSIYDQYLLISSQTSLKMQSLYNYQIQLYSRHLLFIKKWRIEKPSPHSISLIQFPQPCLLLCPNQGYNLLVYLPDINITYEIKSIYKLLLTQIKPNRTAKNRIQLLFSHNQLIAGTRLCYDVDTEGIRKSYKQQIEQNQEAALWQSVEDGDGHFQIGVKDWVSSYGNNQGIQILLKAKYGRKVKMCAMLEAVMEYEVGKISSDLLREMCSLIQ